MGFTEALPLVPVAAENRTWRALIECGFDLAVGDRLVRFHREVVPVDAQGRRAGDSNQTRVVVGDGTLPLEVQANFSQLQNREFTAAGVTVSGAQMMALIAKVGDTLWQEKVAAELQRQAVLAAQQAQEQSAGGEE